MPTDRSIEVKLPIVVLTSWSTTTVQLLLLFLKFPGDVLLLLFEFCAFFFNFYGWKLESSKIVSFFYTFEKQIRLLVRIF